MRRSSYSTVVFAVALTLTGCGGDDDAASGEAPVADGADDAPADDEPAAEDQADEDVPEEDEPGDASSPDDPLARFIPPAVLDNAEDVVELETDDGVRVVAAMTCNPGQTILQAGFVGAPQGIYEAVVEPNDGQLTVAVQNEQGVGGGGYQGSWDESPEYDVTFEELGIEFTIAGCPAE